MDTDTAMQKGESPLGFGSRLGAAVGSWVRACLGKPRISWIWAGLAICVLLPTVLSGLALDDFFERLVVEGTVAGARGRLDLFNFISAEPQWRARFRDLGVYPWWIGPHTQMTYWRPVAALTHFVDFSLWPRAAWLLHVENLAWYGALVVACGSFYRRFISVPWVAGLAVACYAFDHAHAFPVVWIANRNAMMSAFFGVLSLLAHHRWRSESRLASGALAWFAFALALLSAESGAAIAGYMVAYALVFETGIRQRLLSIAPYALIGIVWRVAYRALGYGVFGSDINLDPLLEPYPFLTHSLQTIPLVLASETVALPPDILRPHPAWLTPGAIVAVAIVAVFGYALLPAFRSARSSRFFAAGAALSVVPFGGTFPIDRYFFWVGLGMMGLVAQLAGGVFGEHPWSRRRVRGAVCCVCLFLRCGFSPMAFFLRSATPGLLEDAYEQMAATIPRGPNFARQTVVVLSMPIDLALFAIPIIALAKGLPMPAHMYTLYAGAGAVTVSRAGSRTLEMAADRGWLAPLTGRSFRNTSIPLDETVRLPTMSARVAALGEDGRPDKVLFTFPTNLDDPSLVFLSWGLHGFDRVNLPSAGAALTVDEAQILTPDVVRWRLRSRPFEDGQLFTGD